MNIKEIEKQIQLLQDEVARLKGEQPKPTIEITKIKSKEGYVFKRTHDGMIMGNEISLGYDYSLGFKRRDKKEFYKEVEEEK